MDFISWSATLLKLNGFDGTQSFQLPQPTGALSAYWPWISGQHGAPPNPTSLILDLAVLEAAAVNNFWHPTETNSLSVANIVTSETNDKQHQLSFGIDRILGDQIGVNRPKMFAQVPGYARSHESEKQNISTVQKQEAVIDKQAKESRQKLHEQQEPVDHQHMGSNNNNRRKRSWSRAVFSNLQRKGLEKRFQLQKYITKPDRRQLAATLGLTDAQVKVWFQNRRMKWRHNKESHSGNSEETPCSSPIEQYLEAAEDLQCREHYR